MEKYIGTLPRWLGGKIGSSIVGNELIKSVQRVGAFLIGGPIALNREISRAMFSSVLKERTTQAGARLDAGVLVV